MYPDEKVYWAPTVKTNYTPKTYREGKKFFGRILLVNGYDYYIGPFNSRSAARRAVLRTLSQ